MHQKNQPSSLPWTIYLTIGTLREIISIAWLVTLPLMWVAYDREQPIKKRKTAAKIFLAMLVAKMIFDIVLVLIGQQKWYLGLISLIFSINSANSLLKILLKDE
jgi:energy-converting hydrogenase Eha subunit A